MRGIAESKHGMTYTREMCAASIINPLVAIPPEPFGTYRFLLLLSRKGSLSFVAPYVRKPVAFLMLIPARLTAQVSSYYHAVSLHSNRCIFVLLYVQAGLFFDYKVRKGKFLPYIVSCRLSFGVA